MIARFLCIGSSSWVVTSAVRGRRLAAASSGTSLAPKGTAGPIARGRGAARFGRLALGAKDAAEAPVHDRIFRVAASAVGPASSAPPRPVLSPSRDSFRDARLQSTGQGGTHKVAPVHSDGNDSCAFLAWPRPTIGFRHRRGHACMHRRTAGLHPRYRRFTAKGRGRGDARRPFSGWEPEQGDVRGQAGQAERRLRFPPGRAHWLLACNTALLANMGLRRKGRARGIPRTWCTALWGQGRSRCGLRESFLGRGAVCMVHVRGLVGGGIVGFPWRPPEGERPASIALIVFDPAGGSRAQVMAPGFRANRRHCHLSAQFPFIPQFANRQRCGA